MGGRKGERLRNCGSGRLIRVICTKETGGGGGKGGPQRTCAPFASMVSSSSGRGAGVFKGIFRDKGSREQNGWEALTESSLGLGASVLFELLGQRSTRGKKDFRRVEVGETRDGGKKEKNWTVMLFYYIQSVIAGALRNSAVRLKGEKRLHEGRSTSVDGGGGAYWKKKKILGKKEDPKNLFAGLGQAQCSRNKKNEKRSKKRCFISYMPAR